MPGGRPPLFKTPEQLEKLVEQYFETTERCTLAGLAVFLGMSRRSLYYYDEKDEFLHIIKKARERVEALYEERAIYDNTPTGVIFALKNMGWSDKLETDNKTQLEVKPPMQWNDTSK